MAETMAQSPSSRSLCAGHATADCLEKLVHTHTNVLLQSAYETAAKPLMEAVNTTIVLNLSRRSVCSPRAIISDNPGPVESHTLQMARLSKLSTRVPAYQMAAAPRPRRFVMTMLWLARINCPPTAIKKKAFFLNTKKKRQKKRARPRAKRNTTDM